MIDLDYLLLSLKTDKDVQIGPSRISELLCTAYNQYFPKKSIGHNGDDPGNGNGSAAYFYPRLQYKVVRGAPMIAAVNEGCELLWNLYDQLDGTNIEQDEWRITEKRLIDRKAPFGISSESVKYRFLTPWLSLPEEGFKRYLVLDEMAKERMLIKILEGHIRSVCESLEYELPGDLKINMNAKSNYIFQRDIKMAGLFGSFVANFEIPNFLGLGKSVSRGFGTIKRV
jgi:hypothetical protein